MLDQLVQRRRRRLVRAERAGECGYGCGVVRRTPAPEEGVEIEGNGHAVQLDRPLDGSGRQRQITLLPGEADHEEVGGDGVAEEAYGEPCRLDEVDLAGRLLDGAPQAVGGELEVGMAGEVAGHDWLEVDDSPCAALPHGRQGCPACGDDEVAAEQEVGPAVGHARAPSSACVAASLRCETTAPPFWARPIMSIAAKPLPSRWAAMPRRAAMVTTPVPPMPVTTMPNGPVERRQHGLGQHREGLPWTDACDCLRTPP